MGNLEGWCVYELTDPQDKIYEPIYVGVTTNPQRRYNEHLKGKTLSTRAWVGHLHRLGRMPHMTLLYETGKFDALRIETATIESHTRAERRVLNHGGWDPARWEAEHQYWIRRARLDSRYKRLRDLLDREFRVIRIPAR